MIRQKLRATMVRVTGTNATRNHDAGVPRELTARATLSTRLTKS